MNVRIFSTDQSCMEIIDLLPCENVVTCIIVPTNRRDTPKVKAVIDAANSRSIEVGFHRRGHHVEANLPPADAAISWLYSQIIAVDDLNSYPSGILNMHGGKIPEYRGESVVHWAIRQTLDRTACERPRSNALPTMAARFHLP